MVISDKVESVLTKEFPPPDVVELKDREDTRRVVGIVVSKRFEGLDSLQRLDLIDQILDDGLKPQDRRKVLAIVALTPREGRGYYRERANRGSES